MKITDAMKTSLIRKGNELFNTGQIDEAYRCYLTVSYFTGIERVADYYNFDKKEYLRAYRLYRMLTKENSNLGGNVRVKAKIDDITTKHFLKAIRKWMSEDVATNNDKPKRTYHSVKNTSSSKDKFHSH
jgi:hypothetical protein